MDGDELLARAREVLDLEARGIARVAAQLGEGFVRAVEIVEGCRGKVVVTGLGKSGLVARKIAATLAGTGTPAVFLHAADGLHGDLGMVTREDVVLAVSNSGETAELRQFLPALKRLDLALIVITGNVRSTLSRVADVVLDAGVEREACPLDLTPTASTTAALALGDALAVVLLQKRGFREEDFALRHPGGSLGRRLRTVGELMHRGAALPLVQETTAMKDVLLEITSKRLGVTAVVDPRGALTGIITDGDLRRALERTGQLLQLTAADVMTRHPKVISPDALAARALALMEQHSITSLVVLPDGATAPEGVIHMHDLLEAGVA
ncbi:MAG: KpsF/GutQ family sugar-phosphate isomerase [Candidatus Rokubacteria bacterium]|nr:KpsF/GutQ family sugar-phosphate isomerase [Candidatus Rokubacteria bacterium]